MSNQRSGWTTARLADVAAWSSGGTPKAGTAAYYGGDIPWAVIGDLNDGIVASTAGSITQDGLENSSAKWIPEGAVLIAMYGWSIGKLGIAGVPLATNQAIAAARPNDSIIDAKYLFYYLMSQRHELKRAGKGAAQPNIGQGVLKAWPIPIAPLDEQRRVVDILEDHLSRLDVGQRILATAEARLDLVIDAMIADGPEVRSAATKPLAEVLASPLSNGKSVPTADDGFPVLRLTAMRDGVIDLAERKTGKWTAETAAPFLVARGDVFAARGNGSLKLVGRAARVIDEPDLVAYPDTMIRMRPDQRLVRADFLTAVWNSRSVRRQIESRARTTAGIYKVNQKDLRGVVIPVPSTDDQASFMARIDEWTYAVGGTRRSVATATRRAEALRRSLLAAAFSGRLTGSESDIERAEELAGV